MPSLRVLVDAGALIALLNRNDAYHERVSDFFADYFGHAYSTWPVLTETAHLVPEHLSVSVLRLLERGRLQIVEITPDQYPLPAKRPRNPVISKDKIKRVFGIEIALWAHQLRTCLAELGGRQ